MDKLYDQSGRAIRDVTPLGGDLNEQRKKKGLTLEDLAARAGLDYKTVQRAEQSLPIKTKSFFAITKILGLDPKLLMKQDKAPYPEKLVRMTVIFEMPFELFAANKTQNENALIEMMKQIIGHPERVRIERVTNGSLMVTFEVRLYASYVFANFYFDAIQSGILENVKNELEAEKPLFDMPSLKITLGFLHSEIGRRIRRLLDGFPMIAKLRDFYFPDADDTYPAWMHRGLGQHALDPVPF